MQTKKFIVLAAISLIASFMAAGAAIGAEEFHAPILSGAQENPQKVTDGTGVGTASFDIATNLLSVAVSFSDLESPTADAHIHCCAADTLTNAVVAIGFTSTGFPIGVTSGAYSHTFDLLDMGIYGGQYLTASGGTAVGARDRLLSAMRNNLGAGLAYFNVHTNLNPGGEIRGNISPVPEPTSLMLLASGVVGVAIACRRARRTG